MCSNYGPNDFKRLCKNGKFLEAFSAADCIFAVHGELPARVFYTIVQSCLREASLEHHQHLLGFIVRHKLVLDSVTGCRLIRRFTLHRCLPESNQVFKCLENPNKHVWSAIISANATLGQGEKALELYHQMLDSGTEPDGHIFVAALKGCAKAGALWEGRQIESDIRGTSCMSNIIVANALTDMYVKCESLEDASRVFAEMPNRDRIAWNTLIWGYAAHGNSWQAFTLFFDMLREGMEPDSATIISVLKTCNDNKYAVDGKVVHALAVEESLESDARLGNALIHMYAVCGNIDDSCRVFDNMPKNLVTTWNAMMSGYIQESKPTKVLSIFQLMQQKGVVPNQVTFLCIIKACTEMSSIDSGKQVHGFIIETSIAEDVTINNALIDMYAKCGGMDESFWVFNTLQLPAIITWNTLISCLTYHKQAHRAFKCFNEMLQREMQPDQATFVNILKACSPELFGAWSGFEVHAFIIWTGFEQETIVGNSLIDMYIRFGELIDAQNVFDKLWMRDIVSWNTMMAGCIHHLYNQEALFLFEQMHIEGVEPDCATLLCLLKACSDILVEDQVNSLFHIIIESGSEFDAAIQNSILNMYIKCGGLKNASCVYCRLSNIDSVTWNALIAGHAEHGDNRIVQHLLKSMDNEGVSPDSTTFLSILSSIGHMGLLIEGRSVFQIMQDDYGVLPMLSHFNCLVDLLGRAGLVKEAEDLLQSMPQTPDIIGWTSLLGHCETHSDFEVGKRSYNNFVSLNNEDATGYVLVWKILSQLRFNNGAD